MSYRFWLRLLALCLLVGPAVGILHSRASAAPGDWPVPRYDAAATRYNRAELQMYPPLSNQPDAVILPTPQILASNLSVSPVMVDGRLFWYEQFTDEAATVYATDLDGELIWQYAASSEIRNFGEPIMVADNLVLARANDRPQPLQISVPQTLKALDAATGELRWQFPLHRDVIAVAGGTAYIFWREPPLNDHVLSAVRLSDGAELYRQPAQFIVGPTAVPVILDSTLYLYSGSHLRAYRLSDGVELWEYHDEANSSTVSVRVTAAANMIVLSQADRIVGVNATTGVEEWQTRADPGCWSDSTVPVTDGVYVVQVGVCNSQLQAYLLASGTSIWSANVDHFASDLAAAANGVVYAAPWLGASDPRIVAFRMDSGDLLQDIDIGFWPSEMMIAGGTLYVTDALENRVFGYDMADDGDGYLESWDNDGNPLTNPRSQVEIPLTQRVEGGQSTYGAEIQVGAFIGTEPAILRVYHTDGALYKEATTQPNRLGHGFWIVPVEYTTAGYQYDVELGDGERLTLRTIRMPGAPGSNLRLVELLDGLTWLDLPASINSLPAQIALQLPDDFPAGEVDALLMVESPTRGSTHIPGVRDGNRVVFEVTRNNVVEGAFSISAVASAGNTAAFSDERAVIFNAPGLRRYMAGQVTTVGHAPDGSIESVTYQYERDLSAADDTGDIDAEIGQIIPYGGGFHVVVHATTPTESDPDKLNDRPYHVQVTGRDRAGNPISQDMVPLPPNLVDAPITFELPQNGARPIERIELSTLEIVASDTPQPGPNLPPLPPPPPPPPPPNLCSDSDWNPDEPDPEDEDPNRQWHLRDLFSVSTSAGVAASAVKFVGAGGGTSVSYDWIYRETSACAEYGLRGGKELSVGPSYSMNFGLNLRGPGHDAPASSGKKVNLTAAVGVGVDLSYTIPDNWQSAGFGTISLGFTAAPKAGISTGISQVHCNDLTNNPPPPNNRRRDCCSGPCNDPPNLPGPPGNNHPDDTLSVVLFNAASTGDYAAIDSWATLMRMARVLGFRELADYGLYRTRLDVLGLQMASIPDALTLDELEPEQQQLVGDYLHLRTHEAARHQARWPTILSQWERLMAGAPQVLANGYYVEALAMLDSYAIPSRLVPVSFSPDAMEGLLIIPTGGLFGLADVEAFRARLARFVERGGTVLVMSQPENDSLDALPGANGLEQVGYVDDIACFQDAMTWQAFHPMLASLRSSSVDAHVDGYMTSLPDNAQQLLERTKNQQGAFALYPHGDGTVIVTNLYEDWGRTVGQSSPPIRALFRDVVRWAEAPEDLPDVRPNGTVQVPMLLVNHSTEETATQVRFILRNPNELEHGQLDPVAVNLTPGAGQSLSANVSVPANPLGIWRVNYVLLNGDDRVIQEETLGSRFTLSDPPALPAASAAQVAEPRIVTGEPPEAHATATLHQSAYAPGETVQVTLDIEIPDVSELGELRVMASLGETTETQFVSAQPNQQVQFSLPADFSGNGLLFFGVYNEETAQGMVLDTLWVPARGQYVTVTTDRFRYAPGDLVTLAVESDSARAVYFQGPGIDREVDLAPGAGSVEFTLPAAMASGPFTVRYDDGPTVRALQFDVKGPQLKIMRIDAAQTTAAAGNMVPGEVHIQSDRDLDVFLVGTLSEPGSKLSQAFVEEVSLSQGDQVVPVSIPFEVRRGGMIQFGVAVMDRANPSLEYVRATRNIATNTPELMAARAAELATPVGATTRLLLDWYSPTARSVDVTVYGAHGPLDTRQVSVGEGFSTTELDVELEGGSYDLIIAGEVDGLRTVASAVVVVESALEGPDWLFMPILQR